ncbi:hypothetical protein KY289_000984 [Solanum tuberosum]|nr:hypothetical protein KY284_003681 [Solanum tuberosum]KAH0729784.1 hypothetical protein KY289_000972 [Solanum tuberosum]KAH0729789.1 hypothetical protein KY289_000977 [Solanum tuberosum]KAH0729796.1 hypothetical protein KY289_000984 [Solanum tuberosum]
MNDGCDHTSTNAPDPIRTPKLSVLGESSTRMETTSIGLTGDGGVGRMGVTGGVMRRCAWRQGRWGAG